MKDLSVLAFDLCEAIAQIIQSIEFTVPCAYFMQCCEVSML